MTEQEAMGKRIRDLRVAHKMSQYDLSQRVGLQQSSVHKWETGNFKRMPEYHIDRLCRILDCSIGYLKGWDAEVGSYNQDEAVLSTMEKTIISAMRRNIQFRQAVYSL